MIRRWFFILMAVNMVFIGLFCWEEWRPEWKEQFWKFREIKRAALQAELEQATSRRDSDATGLAGLRLALAAEEARLEQPEPKAELGRLSEGLAEAQERLEHAVDNYQKNYSLYQTLEISYHQMADDDPHKESRAVELRKLALRLEHMKEEEGRITAEVERLDSRLSEITAERQRLAREIKQAEAEVAQLRNSIAKLEAQRPAIEQISNLELGRVDRCVTCHLGIDDPHFVDVPEPLKSHVPNSLMDIGRYHPFQTYGCTICHEGQGLATRLAEAFGHEAHFHQPVLGRDLTQGSCLPCHPERIALPELPALEAAPLLEQGRRLFADKGCTGCHETEPFNHLTRTGPKLNSIGHKVANDWLYRWLRKPTDYLPATNMPDFLLPPEEIRQIADYLLLSLVETQPAPAPPPPADSERAYENGRAIFQVSRCISCHALEGKGGTSGPDLYRVASKLNRDWLFSWLNNPPAHDPQTLMPHFRFTAEERLDLVEYITQEFVDWDRPDSPDPVEGAAAQPANAPLGEALVRRYGCAGCHEMPGSTEGQKVSTELTDYGTKTADLLDFGWAWDVPRTRLDWTMTKLRTPRLFRDNLLMPDYRFSEDESLALTTVLLALKGDPPPARYLYFNEGRPLPSSDGPRMSSPPPVTEFDRLVDDLRCRSCHRLGDWGGDLAPALDLIGSRFEEPYLRFFLKTPEAIRPLLVERMLRLNLDDREIDLLVQGLRFLTTDDVRVPRSADRAATGDPRTGEQLYRSLGCEACHMIGSAGGASGPNLTEVGRRLKLDYLYAWLRAPHALVPAAIEPDYGLDEEQAGHLAAWLKGLTGEGGP
jgi:cbb3-type cytochrome oxidase cytochrome c subunit